MRRFPLRWLALLFLMVTFSLPLAHAQRPYSSSDSSSTESTRPVPAGPYGVAVISFLVVMIVVCTPSRKRTIS